MNTNKTWTKLIGVIICLVNVWWMYDNAYLLYCYHYKAVFYFSMYPDWVLAVNSIIGLVGFVLGILAINGKVRTWLTLMFNLLLWTFGVLIRNAQVFS